MKTHANKLGWIDGRRRTPLRRVTGTLPIGRGAGLLRPALPHPPWTALGDRLGDRRRLLGAALWSQARKDQLL